MRIDTYQQLMLFSNAVASFPSTRYQGSKAKLADWIWEQIADLDFDTCLDAFGGTGAVAYRLKQEGKTVTYNDILRFNYYIGKGIIENCQVRLLSADVERLLYRHANITYPTFVQDTFPNIYFNDDENAWIDQTITNICQLTDPYKYALAFFALCQACMVKRPYNLFHRKNLYMRFADVERSFGNKTSWDKPFDEWFWVFVEEGNQAVFDNSQPNRALNQDALDVRGGPYDLIYIDTPYISRQGVAVDYHAFYHFLEGLTIYDTWNQYLDRHTKHRRLKLQPNQWTDKKQIYIAFDQLFSKYRDSILVVSYRSDGIPSELELTSLLRRYKSHVQVEHFGHYKYVLSTNSKSKEILLIGT